MNCNLFFVLQNIRYLSLSLSLSLSLWHGHAFVFLLLFHHVAAECYRGAHSPRQRLVWRGVAMVQALYRLDNKKTHSTLRPFSTEVPSVLK